ncbi:MAG: LamG domain-containing protein [Bacteroidetes bacterium]|nr:LamG domain-containing protein [Bacteroidota bacterium]
MKKNQIPLLAIVILLAMASCKKLDRPVLPKNYPTDNPVNPTTSLRFFLSFDSTTAKDAQLNIRFKDSISGYPCFFPDPSIGYMTGVTGTALQGSSSALIHYVNANDFATSTSFTISFWLNASLAQKDHANADGLLCLPSTTNFWSNFVVFADHESSTSDSMQLKFVFANGTGNNWDFAGYTGTKRWPKMYDGNWHHVVFVYDATAKTGTLYRDGVQFDQKANETIAFDGNATGLVVGGFQEMLNIVDKWSNNGWMSGWPGGIDQVRLYNTALAASDVQSLYSTKQ